MKKLMLAFIICLSPLSVMAQTEHMKFMGIPIDGKISAFQRELKKKGFREDERIKLLPKNTFRGAHFYKGLFAEEMATLVVYFNEKTKIVDHTRIYINCSSKRHADDKYEFFRKKLLEKYKDIFISKDSENTTNEFGFAVLSSDKTRMIGFIYIEKKDDSDEGKHSVAIEYYDAANYNHSKDRVLDDL